MKLLASHVELKSVSSKSADQILASVKRFCLKTQRTLCGELWIHVTRIDAPFAWKVVRQYDGYTYF